MPVRTPLSDLFFNRDISAAKQKDKDGRFEGFIRAHLLAEADDMLSCLRELGVPNDSLTSAECIVDDFLRRV